MIQVFLAFFSGAALVMGSLLVAGMLEPVVTTPEFRPLPVNLETIARWGKLKTYVVRGRPPAPPLPIRVPGAALVTMPPVELPIHVNDPTEFIVPRWLPARLYRWILRKADAYQVIEPHDSFARWWEDQWSGKRKYAGRHRRETLEGDRAWRTHWARFPTSHWPTLATVANAWEIMAQDVRPMICSTEMWMLSPRHWSSAPPSLQSLSSFYSGSDSSLVSSAT